MKLSAVVLCGVSVLTLASCTTSKQGNAGKEDLVKTARSIIGTELIGTKGASPKDQDNIDSTVAGACAAGVYTKPECRHHQELLQ